MKEAAKRGLPNLRRTPEALAQLITKQSRKLLAALGILTDDELESRYHVRVERYIKDMLIEMHTLREMVDTLVLPAAFGYAGTLAASAAQAKSGGHQEIPQVDRANEIGKLAKQLKTQRDALAKIRSTRPSTCTTTRPRPAMLLTKDGRRHHGGRPRRVRCAGAARSPTMRGRCRSTGRCSSRFDPAQQIKGPAQSVGPCSSRALRSSSPLVATRCP